VDANGIITTVAGNGVNGYSGDGGLASNAELSNPVGVAVDQSGNLFFADQNNQRIRKVATTGIITTVAGNAFSGDAGDGGAATNASLYYPSAVAVDEFGNLFIADSDNQRIREVGADGMIHTVAGDGSGGFSGDGNAATNASLAYPQGVAVDGFGNLFIADNNNQRIREVITQGPVLALNSVGGNNMGNYDVVVTSPFGSVTSSVVFLTVLLPPSIAQQPASQGAAVGSSASLSVSATGTSPLSFQWYFDGAPLAGQINSALGLTNVALTNAGSYEVVVTNLYGSVTSSAATLLVGFAPAIAAQPTNLAELAGGAALFGVAVSGSGPFTYSWQFNGTNLPDIITTVAGNGNYNYTGDGGAGINASLNYPTGVAVDGFGNLFIPDQDNARIRKVDANGIITTVAGNGGYGYSGDGGAATNSWLYYPEGVALDGFGNLFIADTDNRRIRKVDTNGIITTVAGNGIYGFSGDGGAAINARLSYPLGVAVDGFGNVFVADANNSRIRKVDTNGIITTVAGNGNSGYSGDGGPATSASFYYPQGVAVDGFGNLFIADTDNSRIRKVDTNGIITTVAGNGSYDYTGDGGAANSAGLNSPIGVAVDGFGNLFIADTGNNCIRQVDIFGIITTAAGNGTNGYSGDGASASNAELSNPLGEAVDGFGNVFVADANNSRIREVHAPGPMLRVPNTGAGNAGNYDVVVTSPYGSVTSSVVSLTVLFPPSITQQPAQDTVTVGNSAAFSVSAAGTLPLSYQWYVDGAPLAGQTNGALGLANVGLTNAGNYTVVVSNLYGSVTSSVAILLVGFAPAITVQPSTQVAMAGGSPGIAMTVSGTGPLAFQWQFNGVNLPNAVIATVAGNGAAGYSGDGGAAIHASLSHPEGLAVDGAGNLFIADFDNNRVRKVDANGTISTVVGDGLQGYSGDGGTATNASLSRPSSLAMDGAGNLFISDYDNNRVRKVDTSGIITTVAGNGLRRFAGDGGPATSASLFYPQGLAVDDAGNLFIADTGNSRVRKVDTNGLITTVAGSGTEGYDGDGGAATSASLSYPGGVAVDGSGCLFIADSDNSRIRKVDTNGIITTVTGNGLQGRSGDGGAAASASLYYPRNLTVDGFGQLFLADQFNDRIRKVDGSGIITTVAGNGGYGYSGDGGAPTNASLYYPSAVAVDGAGNMFIADLNNQRIRKVIPQGPTLALNNVGVNNAGNYSLVLTSPFGSVTSSVVSLTIATSPLIYSAARQQNGAFTLSFVSPPNSTNVVLSATSLAPPVNWQPISTNLAGPDGDWQFTDTNTANSPARFYRSATLASQ